MGSNLYNSANDLTSGFTPENENDCYRIWP